MTRQTTEQTLPAPRRRFVRRLAGCASLWCLAPLVARADGGTPIDLTTLLKRVQASGPLHSFTGVYLVSAAGSMSSARLVHYGNGREQIDKIESLDGQMRRIYRHNDLVHVLWPQTHEATIEPRDLLARWPGPAAAVARRPGFAASGSSAASNAGAEPSTADVYDAVLVREERLAGYEAQVITLRPRDAYRFGQRWWVERETGLLMRTDVLNSKGEVLESAGFSELQLGTKVQPKPLLQEMHSLQGYRVQQPQFTRTTLEQEGWTLRKPVPGYRLHACVRRTPPRPHGASETVSAASPQMLQAIYTDGLMHVSVFIEPYDASRHGQDAPTPIGATRIQGRREGDWWITTVGEVPTAALAAFAQGLERVKS